MKKISSLVVAILLISSTRSNGISELTEHIIAKEYPSEARNKTIAQVDKHVNDPINMKAYETFLGREGTVYPLDMSNDPRFQPTPEQAKRLEAKVRFAQNQARNYIKFKASTDDVFFAKLQNPDNFSYGQAPFMQECYADLGWPSQGKEGQQNMMLRFKLMDMLQEFNKDLKENEKNLAQKLSGELHSPISFADVHNTGMKTLNIPVETPSMFQRFVNRIRGWFGQGPSNMTRFSAENASTPKASNFSWQKLRQYTPVMPSAAQVRERVATRAAAMRYNPAPASASKALKQQERFGIGYQ